LAINKNFNSVMRKKKNVSVFLMMIVSLLLSSTVLLAQPPDEDDTNNVSVPFDGGLSMVIATGAAYAIKKARDKTKQQDSKKQVEK
jgi:hypothetical protein